MKSPVKVVFENGRFSPALSSLDPLPLGLTLARDADNVQIVMAPFSEATVIEQYMSSNDAKPGNGSTRIQLQQGASLDHYLITEFGTTSIDVHQGNASRYRSYAFSFGGIRNTLAVHLEAEGSECTLTGLYIAKDRDQIEEQLRIDHLEPHGTSRVVYKGIIDGQARGLFNGDVIVHPNAQKTDAEQSIHNLLLSDGAEAAPKPQFEIFADDVKCSHGATVGELDADQLFYLESRGIDAASARALLTFAFANEIVEKIPLESMRAYIEKRVRDELRDKAFL